jgi:CelD/BcsL family acetyltransferase involved in cellulose biosynthesis
MSHTVTLLKADEALGSGEIRRRWQDLLGHVDPLSRGIASAQWFELRVRSCPGAEKRLAVMRDGQGDIVGLCPLEAHAYYFTFNVSSRSLLRPSVLSAVVMGDEPMIPADPEAHWRLYRGILDQWPVIDGITVNFRWEGAVSNELRDGGGARGLFTHVQGHGPALRFVLPLKGDYEHYLKTSVSPKRRYTIRKEAKALQAFGKDRLELIRVDRPDMVGPFLERAIPLYEKTWQYRDLGWLPNSLNANDMGAFAEAGILRSYLLECGGEVVAFMLGIQSEGVYYFLQTGYEPSFAEKKLAPGKVMINMIIQELCEFNKADYFDFGPGENFYKQFFGCVPRPFAHVCILRDRLRNRVLCGSHRLFRSGVGLAKRIIRRGRTQPSAAEDAEGKESASS